MRFEEDLARKVGGYCVVVIVIVVVVVDVGATTRVPLGNLPYFNYSRGEPFRHHARALETRDYTRVIGFFVTCISKFYVWRRT